jgi:hypothetical protein
MQNRPYSLPRPINSGAPPVDQLCGATRRWDGPMKLTRRPSWKRLSMLATGVLALPILAGAAAHADSTTDKISFDLVRSASARDGGCLRQAEADVTVETVGANQVMTVSLSRMPANTAFVLFVIQVPDAPFGMGWYQGDVDTGLDGTATETFIGRFNIETFVVAPGSAPAPDTHPGIDATSNPATAPVHMYHLGLWFDRVDDAVKAGCPDATTPFNGDHTAGIQALSTRNFPDGEGPLSKLPE